MAMKANTSIQQTNSTREASKYVLLGMTGVVIAIISLFVLMQDFNLSKGEAHIKGTESSKTEIGFRFRTTLSISSILK